jgi:hypothetical protein
LLLESAYAEPPTRSPPGVVSRTRGTSDAPSSLFATAETTVPITA